MMAKPIPIQVDCDFPGGNILVDRIEGDLIEVHQDLRDTESDWFYWYFRVRGAAGCELTVRFTGSDVIGVRGPAVSLDGGLSWRWLGRAGEQAAFTYTVPAGAEEVRFSFGMPYLQSTWKAFIRPYAGHPALRQGTLCTSRKGRPVEMLTLGRLDGQAPFHALFTARHHCCEMIANYAMEGIIETVLGDSPDGQWLREHAALLMVPFMDKDGVEDGDQGKLRRPHDHNRDYAGESIYPEVAALRELAPRWSDGQLVFYLDMHCPWIRGDNNEFIYLVGDRGEACWSEVQRFSDILESCWQGPLPYFRANNLPYGKSWNVSDGSGRLHATEWAVGLPGMHFSSTMEIPYANVSGVAVTPENARLFGRDIVAALRRYLESLL